MKKLVVLLLALSMLFCASAAMADAIKVGVVNNPPSESGYRAANVADFERVFSAENGYDVRTTYTLKNDEQIAAAQAFITDGVDYLLISAADTTGWDETLAQAQEAGVKVFLFDRMIDCDPSLYEAAVVSDMAEEGKTAVNWLLDQKLDAYNVIHIQGVMGSDAQRGRTGALDEQFEAGVMKLNVQQTGNWSADEAKKIVESAIKALDEAGITHGTGEGAQVIVMGFDCNKWALRELLAGNWNYDGQCSPFQADVIDGMIKTLEEGGTIEGLNDAKQIISVEKGFDARTITEDDINAYGLGD